MVRSFSVIDSRDKLASAFGHNMAHTVNLDSLASEFQEIGFDIFSADTFVSGVVLRLVRGDNQLSAADLAILGNTLMDGSRWILDDGSKFDLSPEPSLLKYARSVDQLRVLALGHVNNFGIGIGIGARH